MFKKITFLILGITLFPIQNIFASAMSYDQYVQNASTCDTPNAPWNATNRMVGKIIYPQLDAGSFNSWAQTSIEAEPSTLGKQQLQSAFNPSTIGSLSSLKTLSIVENVYQARMNALFDCAVLESRKSIIDRLKTSGALKGQSEILAKLDRESQKLQEQYSQCLPNNAASSDETLSREIGTRLVNSATFQYCHYRNYLDYLQSNFENNISDFTTMESQIGQGNGTVIPQNSDILARELISRQTEISAAIDRADRVLPKAITAYKDMERTYAAHILLVIIYDDYVRLRDNLHRYMSATSQLFEKANNAMSPK